MSTILSSAPPSIMSPTFSTTAATSLPKTLLYPSDIETSIATYEQLLDSAKAYRNQLAALSQSANHFGAALEACSRTKGVDEAAEGLSNVAGMQYLVANHQSVLSDTIYRSFEIPLRENLENFIDTTAQRREEYKNDLAIKMKLLAKREKEHLALAHKKQRSLVKFREALADLTKLADEIDKLKSDYFYSALDYHCETWSRVAIRANIVCKAELSLYAGVAQKAEHLEWSLVGTPDPWTQDARCGDEIFHIVPPQDILARPQSPTQEVHGGLFQSLLGTVDVPTPVKEPITSTKQVKEVSPDKATFQHLDETASTTEQGRSHSYENSLSDAEMERAGVTASPYQDAEEDTLSCGKHTDATRLSLSPSRPVSRRSESQIYVTPSRARLNSWRPNTTPQSIWISSDSMPMPLPQSAPVDVSAAQDHWDSPEASSVQKHSEYRELNTISA